VFEKKNTHGALRGFKTLFQRHNFHWAIWWKNGMQICEMTAKHICLHFCKGPEVQIYTVTPTVAEREPRNVSVICNAICAICKFFDCTKA